MLLALGRSIVGDIRIACLRSISSQRHFPLGFCITRRYTYCIFLDKSLKPLGSFFKTEMMAADSEKEAAYQDLGTLKEGEIEMRKIRSTAQKRS